MSFINKWEWLDRRLNLLLHNKSCIKIDAAVSFKHNDIVVMQNGTKLRCLGKNVFTNNLKGKQPNLNVE